MNPLARVLFDLLDESSFEGLVVTTVLVLVALTAAERWALTRGA